MLIIELLVNTGRQKEKNISLHTFSLLIGHTHFSGIVQYMI